MARRGNTKKHDAPVQRVARGHFAAGVSGNPNGRPAVSREIRELARQYGPHALLRLVELSRSREGPVAVHACRALLDRGYGRPEQAIINGDGVSAADLAAFQTDLIRVLERYPDALEAVRAAFARGPALAPPGEANP